MKYVLITFCLLALNISISAQQVVIEGHISDADDNNLVGATIRYDSDKGVISDLNGNFKLYTNKEESILLNIQYIGFESIDTSIIIAERESIKLEIVMTENLTALPNVEISASYRNIFDNYKYHISDFIIADSSFYLLTQKGNSQYLSVASLYGTIKKEYKLDEKYNNFFKSCLGSTILVGEDMCAELQAIGDNIYLTNQFRIDYFNQLLLPCEYQKDDRFLIKKISRHNKKIDYFVNSLQNEPVFIYSIYDRIGAQVSQGYYNTLIGSYYAYISNDPGIHDIDFGIARDISIFDSQEEKDLVDLAVSNHTQKLVVQYQSLGLKAVESDLLILNQEIYILDGLNNKVLHFDLNTNKATEVKSSMELQDVDSFITDYENTSYALKGDYLHKVQLENEMVKLSDGIKLKRLYFDYKSQLYEDTLYRLGRESIGTTKKHFSRVILR